MIAMQEQWRDIPGYEGLYQASNTGKIRTSPGKVTSNKKCDKRVWQSRVMKHKHKTNGKRNDAAVTLWKDGTPKDFLVSRLVAMAWVDGYSPELTVNHIDGNPSNNCSENLEWVTRAKNIQKGFEDGLYANLQKAVELRSETSTLLFRSMSDAGRFLGRGPGYIYNSMMRRGKARSVSGEEYTVVIVGDRK